MALQETRLSRAWIARGFTVVEDVVYIGIGLLVAASAMALLANGFITFMQGMHGASLENSVIALLDNMLLVLLVVELLYTVQISIREHSIEPEPFLLVGVIAAVRRVLVITAEFGHIPQLPDAMLQRFLYELVVLTVLILVLVVSLLMLRKQGGDIAAKRVEP